MPCINMDGSSYAEIFESILAKRSGDKDAKDLYKPSWYQKKLSGAVQYVPILGRIFPHKDEKQLAIEQLLWQQKNATSYLEWYEVLSKLDELLGNNTWKIDPKLPFYDYDMLFRSVEELRNARMAQDHRKVLYLMRTKWTRNVANMGDMNLYKHSHVGTKRLIEEFIEECQKALDFLVDGCNGGFDDRYLLGMLMQTRKNIGRTALLLSGGLTFGISHIGVLMTLLERNLLPRIISGSSSGSIIASILCCNNNEEMRVLLASITELEFNIFGTTDAKETAFKLLLARISHLLKYGTFFDIKGLQESMRNFVGDLTFREAHNRTGKILNITVSPASAHEQTRLLNYLTAPNCLIWSAVSASCSLPGIFPSSSIYEKNPRTNEIHEWNNDVALKYVDGSLDGDLPILRLSEMFNVDHIIAVQVNPHVSPILRLSLGSISGWLDNDLTDMLRGLLNNCYDFVTSEIIHYLQIIHEMDISKNLAMKIISVLSQRYSGDITILPALEIGDFVKIFENPTPDFLLDFVLRGARAAWPKVTLINNHCGVEFKLDMAISKLRGRLIASANNRIGYKIPKKIDRADDLASLAQLLFFSDHTPPAEPYPHSCPLTLTAVIPKMRRHNTEVASAGARFGRRLTQFSKSSSKKTFLKGNSTTALHLMDDSNDHQKLTVVRSNGDDSHVPGRRSLHGELRKAQSSGDVSFNNNNNGGNSGDELPQSPVSFRISPKHDRTVHYSDKTLDLVSRFGLEKSPQMASRRLESPDPKENANMPKSRAGSKHSSAIGLSKLNTAPNNDATFKAIKSLNSPDLRRSWRKSHEFLPLKSGGFSGEAKIEPVDGTPDSQEKLESSKSQDSLNDEDDAEYFPAREEVSEISSGDTANEPRRLPDSEIHSATNH